MGRAMFGVDVDLREFKRALRKFPDAIDRVSDRVIDDETEDVARDMRRLAPRATGELADSVQAEHKRGTATGRAIAKARHATFVERGTKRAKAQPFAEPAHELSGPRLRKRLIEAINEDIRRR